MGGVIATCGGANRAFGGTCGAAGVLDEGCARAARETKARRVTVSGAEMRMDSSFFENDFRGILCRWRGFGNLESMGLGARAIAFQNISKSR
jgi:hypothetical protein